MDQKINVPAKPATTEDTLAALVTRYQANIIAALPAHVKPERVLSVIRTAITSNPGLRECAPMSVLAGIVTASRLGLELEPVLGQVYLVPRWNKNTKRIEATFQIGYQGMLELTHRAEQGIIVQVRHVRETDEFQLVYDPKPALIHRVDPRKPRGKVLASYTYVNYPDGKVDVFEPMSIDEALAIRDRFAPKKRCTSCWGRRGQRENCEVCKGSGESGEITGPWVTDEDEMVRKTCLRRNWKWLPKSPEIKDAMRVEARMDAGEAPETVILDLPAEETESAGIAGATDAAKEDLKKRITAKAEPMKAGGAPQAATAVKSPAGPPASATLVPIVDELPDPLDDRFDQFELVNCKNILYRRNEDNTAWNRMEGQRIASGVELSSEETAMGVLAAAAKRTKAKPPQPDAFDFAPAPEGGTTR